MLIDFKNIEPIERYKIMSQSISPRPIAWIVTQGKSLNIAPFSYFSPLSSNPPALIVSIGHKSDGSPKDTLKNILKTKKCTICLAAPENLEKMHYSSKEVAEEISEAEMFKIKTEKIVEGFPPVITETPCAFFCELLQKVDLKGSKTVPLILEVKEFYINDSYVTDTHRLLFELDLLGRSGKNYITKCKKIEPPKIP
ncbi:flavin reductase family protein [Nitrosophilus alvini]|uniref:flavin reductase family protein n=1 Tax=Nitrosophilus alvini TaxID=2714855 RepID=UPI00190DFF14|nr:flavin reductase family protein [Nitrosophilus alvini]